MLVNEENMIPIHDENSEDGMGNEFAESSYLPLCFASFDFLKQILRVSNQTQKLEVMNNDMPFLGMDNEKGE